MQIKVENTSSLGRKLKIIVPKEEITKAEATHIKSLAKKIKLPGFREGNVPEHVIKQRYGTKARQETIAKIIEDSLSNALVENKLNPADRPIIESIEDKSGEDLSYTVTMEIFPEIELQDYAKLNVEKLVADITDKDIEQGLDRLKTQFATWEEKNGRASIGDKVIIDFTGFIDDKPFENGAATDYSLELGSKTFIPGFEEGLLGVKAGEEKDLKIKFADNYGAKELAGKDTVFKVHVKQVQQKKNAEVTKDFAKKIGIEDGDVNKISDKIKENLIQYSENTAETKLRDDILERFLELNPIEVPEVLINREQQLVRQELQRKHVHDKKEEDIKTDARKRVAIALLLNAVIKKHDLKPDAARIRARINEISRMFGQADYIAKMYYESKELMHGITNTVLCDQATDLLVKSATIKEKKSTFKNIADLA